MVHDDDETVHAGRSVDMDFFGTLVTTPGQGSPGRRKLILRERFPWMTGPEIWRLRLALKLYNGFKPHARDLTRLEIAWLRMALKLWRGFKPHARDLRATEDSSFLAIKCILALIAAK